MFYVKLKSTFRVVDIGFLGKKDSGAGGVWWCGIMVLVLFGGASAQKAPLKCRFCEANCGIPWLRAKPLLITFNSSRFLKLLN